MSGRKSISQQNSNEERFRQTQKPTSAGLSNSFNPPLYQQSKPPLPAINSQKNTQSKASNWSVIATNNTTTNVSMNNESDLVLPTKIFKAKRISVNDLTQALCSYLWFRRIKEIFLVMGKQNDAFSRFDMELARADMIQTCEQYLESDRPKGGGVNLSKPEQDKIDRWKNKRLYAETFRMSYYRKETDVDGKTMKTLTQTELSGGELPNFDNAIWWYSCNEAPIYDQMNNILRLENFELLMFHRYYISDLCQMIERSYLQNKPTQKLVVYRADKISTSDFEIYEKSKGEKDSLITINGFISTSRDEKISLEYAEGKLKKGGNDVVIMYEITIDPMTPCSSFADIESISFHPREREILFNMGSTFQIDGIVDDPTNSKIKRIKLTARDYNLGLLDEMKAKVKQSSQAALSILLVRYLIELGEDRVSKRYLNQIIDSKLLENDTNLVSVYNCLGMIHSRQALYGEALDYYRKALNTQARLQFSNNNALAEIFNNIGETRFGLNQLEEAKQNLEEGIRIQKREPKHTQQHLALLYCNMGKVAYALFEYDEAEENFTLSYDLYNLNTKISHDALEKRLLKADLCMAFGHLKSVQNQHDSTEANEKFTEALKIYESTLPANHPKVAEAHINIICEYARNKNFQSVIEYQNEHFMDVLKDYEVKQTTSQQDLANLYAIIGACFALKNEYDKAMEIWNKGIVHEQKSYLDQLFSSARVSKVELPKRLVERAYRAALNYYTNIKDASQECMGFLYAKTYAYNQAVNSLRGKGSTFLANICVLQRNFKGTMVVYKRILELKEYDLTLLIGILLQILAADKNVATDEAIEELLRIDKILANKTVDNESTRLRMIINDCLAEAYLSFNKYDEAIQRSQISYELKQRHFSSYHPSLVRNQLLAASCSSQKGDFKNAVQYYEKAIEIQLDNMPSGHTDIRSNYFLMGDCYCKMGKIELANEFYDQAQGLNELDTNDNQELEQDIKALIRMHSNLADVFAKQNDFSTARTYEEKKVEIFKEILPTFIVEIVEDKDVSSITFDNFKMALMIHLGLSNASTFTQLLHNFVFICSSLAHTMLFVDGHDEDATTLYEQAIELQLKLTLFETAGESRLLQLYENLSKAYAKLYPSMKEEILENLDKALDETTDVNQQRSFEFQLGNLNFNAKNFSGATNMWNEALKKVSENETIIKTIIEKLIEKNKENISNEEENMDDEEEEEDENEGNEDNAEQLSQYDRTSTRAESVKSQRRQSTKSISDKQKPEEMAQAYFELNDNETAHKYFKLYINKTKETLKASWPDTTIQDTQIPIVLFFRSLLIQNITSIVSSSSILTDAADKDVWINILQAYLNIFTIATRLYDSSDEIAKAYFVAFCICRKFFQIPKSLTNAFDLLFNSDINDIQCKQLISILPPAESTTVLMKIAEYHFANENWYDALHIYCMLQNTIKNKGTLKNAIDYGILKLLELYITSDEEYRANVMAVDINSTDIPILDRILLCRLMIVFMKELEEETEVDRYKKVLLTLQTEEWTIVNLETTDCIGHVLTKMENYSLIYYYWNDLLNIYSEMLPQSITSRLYSTDFSLEQILRAAQQMNYELLENTLSLAKTYETIATYQEKEGINEDAYISLEKAIVIWSKIPSAKGNIEQAKMKMKTLQN